MKSIDLNGIWHLQASNPGEGKAMGWPTTGGEGPGFIAASVPGDVHVDLTEAGIIEEPLYGRNALACQWVATKDWWYSREFDVPYDFVGDRVELYFAGLDTTADVWVNGRHVGSHNNMFVPCTMDVTGVVHEGRNLVVVRIDVGLRAAQDKEMEKYGKMTTTSLDLPRLWIRKPQFSFRWDWAPRLLTCGIWRGVMLRSYREVALRDVCLRTTLQPDGSAQIQALVEVENLKQSATAVMVTATLAGHGEHSHSFEAEFQPGVQQVTTEIAIPDPALWWPAPLGEPNLYDYQVSLEAHGEVLDEIRFRYGLREVALIKEPLGDEGESFTIAVNGQKVFCKGANWVPADSLMARVSPAKYRELVRLAAEANFNMLRLWGGGIYEDPYFYGLCDEFGILIWQDFPYACTYYPDDDPGFVAEARREAEIAVKQLRNHPCIALWCGNNENQWLHYLKVQEGEGLERFFGEVLFDEILPQVCARLDPTRPYWPSSPWGGDDPNSEQLGDRHNWYINIQNPNPQTRADYEDFADDRGKFISEYGILAPPALESLAQYLPPHEVHRGSASWAFHNNEFEKGNIQLALQKYWQPAEQLDLAEYITYAQLIQAEALKLSVEHWRRRKFDTSGVLFWMYSDCWGAVGWTIVDYYLRKKSSYYSVRRAFAPVLASIQLKDGDLAFWLVNDTLDELDGILEYGLLNLQTSEVQARTLSVNVPANESVRAAEMDVSPLLPEDRGLWAASARFLVGDQVVSRNRHFLAGLQFNALDMPKARFSHRLDGDALVLEAESFVWQVQIKAPRSVQVGDNFFDLFPGERRRIYLRGPADLLRHVGVTALNE
jgi:beta-mannosidase